MAQGHKGGGVRQVGKGKAWSPVRQMACKGKARQEGGRGRARQRWGQGKAGAR